MKLVRHGPAGAERPGIVEPSGVIRDVSALISDWTPSQLSRSELARWAGLDTGRLPSVPAGTRLGVPLNGVGKFIGIGMNFRDFAREAGRPIPAEPALFTKAISCLTGPDDDVVLPRDSVKTDWEVELGVVIGSTARYVEQHTALEFVAGYCLVNDLSEREFQNDRGGTWDKGKGCDTFGPVGPVARERRRDRRPAESRSVAGGQWPALPGRQHLQHDLSGRGTHCPRELLYDPGAGRYPDHGDAGRCGVVGRA